jgi:hypothetical protein
MAVLVRIGSANCAAVGITDATVSHTITPVARMNLAIEDCLPNRASQAVTRCWLAAGTAHA